MTDPDKSLERSSGGMTDPDKPELERASGGIADPDKPELERASGGMTDPDKPELERASGGMADPDKPELERASGGMGDPDKPELERVSGGMADPDKPELERASGGMADPDKPELERASGGMADPDKPELQRASGEQEPVSLTRQVMSRRSASVTGPQNAIEEHDVVPLRCIASTHPPKKDGRQEDDATQRPQQSHVQSRDAQPSAPHVPSAEEIAEALFTRMQASGRPMQPPSLLSMNYDPRQPLSLLSTLGADLPISVFERQGDKIEISGCGQVNIIMNQEPTDILPDIMAHYQEDYEILFVPTSPFFACKNTLDDHPALMITGAPGSGKTMIAQQLMVKLWDVKKCHPFRVTEPSDYTKNRNPEIPQVFHIDDIFGSSNFVQGKYDAWVPLFGIMRDDIRSKNTFIIFTSRHNILKSNLTDLKNYEVFRYVINVSDKKFKLTEQNKKDIFLNHAKASQLGIGYDDIVAHTQMKDALDAMGYPQRVRLLCAMKDETVESKIRYFCHPMEFLSNIIGSYKEKDHLSYCVLILLLMTDGKLPVSYLHPSNKSSKQVQTCMDICHLSPITTTMGELRDTAENLCGSFLILNDGFYVFQHECIMEASTLHFGQFYPSDILDRCSMQFLLERVFTKVSAPPENEYVVALPSDTYPQLCARLLKEITRCVGVEGKESSDKGDPGSLISLSTYSVFRDPAFLRVFLLHLQDTTSFHILLTSSSRPSQHPTFLFFAAASGQVTLIQEILSSYLCEVQQLPGFNDHLVHVLYAACSGRSPASVRKLLEIGARTDYRTAQKPDKVSYSLGWNEPFTCTTLMHAAYSGNVEVLRLIIDHLQQNQVDMVEHSSLRDDRARTALHWWAEGGRGAAGALQMLLEVGADLHARDKYGWTALHMSALLGHEASIRALVEARADVNVVDKDGRTALHLSALQGHEASILALVEAEADVNMGDKYGLTALHVSALQGHEASIRALVEVGADVNMGDKDGRTALHVSARRGHEASIRALVEAGADVNIRDKDGWTALHWSALQGHETSIRALVEAEADVNVVDKDGETALHVSAWRGHEVSIRALVEAGADVNVGDQGGQTALHLSALLGDEASIRTLVKAGADVNVGNKGGLTALHLSAQQGHEASIRALVEARADVNVGGINGQTALHLSAQQGHEASICALVEAGADVNVVDKDGETALHLSAWRGHEASIRALVEAGANVNIQDKDGRTTLHYAAEKGQANIVRLLVEAGADVHLRASSSRFRPYTDLTPLEAADLCGCTAVADYLRSLTSK